MKYLPASAGDAGDVGLVSGSGISLELGNGNPLQYPCHGLQPMGLQSQTCLSTQATEVVYRSPFSFVL